MNHLRLLLGAALLSGCATVGPHAMSDSLVGADRLTEMEKILATAPNLQGKFDLESKGENAAKMTGVLRLYEGNALRLEADGNFKGEAVQVVLDSRDASAISRAVTKGPSASSNRDPPGAALRETITQGLSRMGLMHNLAVLSMEHPIQFAEGGFSKYAKAINITDGHSDTVQSVPCRRVDFHIEVDGRDLGEATVCIADATGLPLHRRSTVHFPQGDMTLVELYTWEQK